MKTIYVDWDTRGIVDLVKPGELTPCWTITRINVPKDHRGKGIGSRLLKQVLKDADAEDVTLMLEVMPSGGLNYEELYAWYVRYGFTGKIDDYMIRLPQS